MFENNGKLETYYLVALPAQTFKPRSRDICKSNSPPQYGRGQRQSGTVWDRMTVRFHRER